MLSHTDRRGILTTSRYDKENRLLSQVRAGLTLQTLERDANGNVTAQRDALGRLTTSRYDKANRKTSEDRASLAQESWVYTPLGDVQSHTDADRRTTSYSYSPRRYLLSESLAGETTRYTYDGSGHRLSRVRPIGEQATWTYTYDGAGRLASVKDPLNGTTRFGYDPADNRSSVEDAESRSTAFDYDERNRLAAKTYPGGASWAWKYDADGNRSYAKAPGGRITTSTFDALSRPLLTTYEGASAGEVETTAYSHDGNGNLTTVTETGAGTRSETRTYDDFDRVLHVTDANGRRLAYEYDDVGNRTALTDHDGQRSSWTYDALNHNTRASVPGQGITVQAYTPAGRLEGVTRPDGSTSEYIYNDTGRLAALTHAKAGAVLARYTYRYDPNGNRTEQTELNGAATAGVAQSTTYVYDNADRLTEIREPGRTSVYTLDKVGNRSHERVTGAGSVLLSNSTLSYNDRDQLTGRSDPIAGISISQTWDDNGNLASQTVNGGAPRHYRYDGRDRLISLDQAGGPALSFSYHAGGLRSEKSDGSSSTRYQYDGQSLLAETNAIGNTLRQFHYSASQLLAETQAGTTPLRRQYLLDALRSPIALLTLDGSLSARTSYDAFGEIRAQVSTTGALTTPNREAANAELPSTDDQPVGFTGYIKDSESGLYYARARYYDPAVARFTTEDPEAGKDLEPPSLHRYLYAYANPTAYWDPDGRQTYSADAANARARSLLRTEEEKIAFDRSAEKTARYLESQSQEANGLHYGMATNLIQGAYETGKFGLRLAGALLFDVGGEEVVKDVANGIANTADVIRGGPVLWTEYYAQKSLLADELRAQGRHFEAGQLWAPEGATLVTAGAATATRLFRRTATADISATSFAVEGSDGKPALTSLDTVDSVKNPHIGSAWDAPTNTTWNPSAKTQNCIACVASYMRERLGLEFMSSDDIERQIASVDPKRGIQLPEAVRIIRAGAEATEPPKGISPFSADAPSGQYAMFVGPERSKLSHVFHAEKLEDGSVNMFDPQNGQQISPQDLLPIRLKWGYRADAPIVPVHIRRAKDEQ